MARQNIFIKAMEQYRVNIEFTTILDAGGYAGGRLAAKLLMAGFRPSAILSANGFMAAGVLRELRDLGISVPGCFGRGV